MFSKIVNKTTFKCEHVLTAHKTELTHCNIYIYIYIHVYIYIYIYMYQKGNETDRNGTERNGPKRKRNETERTEETKRYL